MDKEFLTNVARRLFDASVQAEDLSLPPGYFSYDNLTADHKEELELRARDAILALNDPLIVLPWAQKFLDGMNVEFLEDGRMLVGDGRRIGIGATLLSAWLHAKNVGADGR